HVHHALWYKQVYSYYGILESLSGQPFDVEFISFEDIRENGIADDIGVIINAGNAGTSYSGGAIWQDPEIVSIIREYVANGGGFIGVGEPTATQHEGEFFQLADVLGVQREMGFGLSEDKYNNDVNTDHFITADATTAIDFGESMRYIYQTNRETDVLATEEGDITLATNTFGDGRGVYIAGLPYNPENARLLERAIYWAASRESALETWHTTNVETECAAFPEAGKLVVINNSYDEQTTTIIKADGSSEEVTLAGLGYAWLTI